MAPGQHEEHRKVQVWVFFREGGESLFLLLKTTPERGGFWQPVTGSVEAGEETDAAALREMSEETALAPLSIRPVSRVFEFESRGKSVREFSFLAEVVAGARTQVCIDPREHVEYQWMSGDRAFGLLKYESNARVLGDVLEFLRQSR